MLIQHLTISYYDETVTWTYVRLHDELIRVVEYMSPEVALRTPLIASSFCGNSFASTTVRGFLFEERNRHLPHTLSLSEDRNLHISNERE